MGLKVVLVKKMFYNYVNGFLTVHNINRKSIQKYAEVQFLKTYLQK